MDENSEKVKDSGTSLIPSSGYFLTQSGLLFSVYGLGYELPLWVLWFPTLIYASIVILAIIVLIIIFMREIFD